MLRRQSTTNNIFHVEHVDKTSASFEGGRTIYEEMDRVQVTSTCGERYAFVCVRACRRCLLDLKLLLLAEE